MGPSIWGSRSGCPDWMICASRELATHPEGKRRLIERLETGRPIAHVADEMGISRRTAAKWYTRYREHGWSGLEEMSSRPLTSSERVAWAHSKDFVNELHQPFLSLGLLLGFLLLHVRRRGHDR